MVFCWHFLHGYMDFPVPFSYAPDFPPMALLDEGHTGVALFMVLSGYLFAKLLQGRSVRFPAFLWNRVLRIAPLLLLVVGGRILYAYLAKDEFAINLYLAKWGWLLPTLPNGGWSVTAEFHFYLLLPLILLLGRRSPWWLPALVAGALLLRAYLHARNGGVQLLAYYTLVGRIDQFVLGMLAYRYRHWLAGRHVVGLLVASALIAFYAWFDHQGGFNLMPSYPSPSRLWIVIPDIEGVAYAALIAYYDSSYRPRTSGISGVIGRFGAYSYSLYLLHFFVVFKLPSLIQAHVMGLSNFYVACAWALLCFVCLYPVGYLSFRFIEAPFLRLRKLYIVKQPESELPRASTSP